ncbi:MAG TPA: hypothetical protein VGT44_14330, partial [Ktedonobacteraceae bacterium]|nr:hypothetical protein [Ktedonobacteraceae bacterium]
QGQDFKLYINGIFVGETQDSTLTKGEIAFASGTDQSETSSEASYSNLKVFRISANSSSTPQGS